MKAAVHTIPFPAPGLRVETRPSRGIDAMLAAEIDALAHRAAEPNPFHEAWMLDAALRHLAGPPMTLLLMRDADDALVGLWPLRRCSRFRGLPLPTLESWQHDYLFLGSPLLAADCLAPALEALLDWLAGAHGPRILQVRAVRADGPVAIALDRAIAARRRVAAYVAHYERALLRVGASADVSGKHRKELRRLERRLAERGDVGYRALRAGDDAEPWIERFLAVEAGGWKGSDGTALASRDGDRAFFVQACREVHRHGRLRLFEMTLDGAPIAVKCNFAAGDGAFMFKIGYDERYAKYSPGLLLELFAMDAAPATGDGTAWVDSCARGGHFMAERLWPERRRLADYTISARGALARALVRNGDLIHRIRRRFGAHGG